MLGRMIAAAALLCVVSTGAMASPGPQACRAFASEAVAAQRENLELGCGFRGLPWSTNATRHYNRCMAMTRQRAEAEANARADRLAACASEDNEPLTPVPQPTGERFCREYAAAAVQDFRRATRLECDVSGIHWDGDPNTHFRWCRRATREDVAAEAAQRARELRACERAGGTPGVPPDRDRFCRGYAQEAVEQAREVRETSCAVSGPAWSVDFNQHYGMCVRRPPQASEEERAMRRQTLRRCSAQINIDPLSLIFCQRYSANAVQQARAARQLNCGFPPDIRWSERAGDHFAFCSTTRRQEVEREERERADAIARCRSLQP